MLLCHMGGWGCDRVVKWMLSCMGEVLIDESSFVCHQLWLGIDRGV